MTFAVYDNPSTMMREAYEDGECIAALCYTITDHLLKCGLPDRIPMCFNIGKFEPGRIVGDKEALEKNNETRCRHS